LIFINSQKFGYVISMVAKKVIYTDKAPAPVGPYNQAIAAQGELVFLAGQIALNPSTGEIVGEGDIVAQTKQVMSNIEAVLTEAGLTWSNVVKTGVFLSDLSNFQAMNEIYGQYFTEQAPARACVEVSRLPKDVLVEIECIAVR
jgi:2-iminobutanoate/2-iminopropanoate deaminase